MMMNRFIVLACFCVVLGCVTNNVSTHTPRGETDWDHTSRHTRDLVWDGHLMSAGYPSLTPPNDHQLYTIDVLGPYVLVIFHQINIGSDGDCSQSFLKLSERRMDYTGDIFYSDTVTLCGSGYTWPVMFTSPIIDVELQAGPNEGAGFHIEYKSDWSMNNYNVFEFCGTTAVDPPSHVLLTEAKRRAAPENRPQQKRVVGGETTTIDQFPWTVLVNLGGEDGVCGGALIHRQWVLTSASCFLGKNMDGVIVSLKTAVHPGDSDTLTLTAAQIIPHPDFDTATSDNDIALIKLSSRVDPGVKARTICLPHPGYTPGEEAHCQLAGYGHTGSGSSESDVNRLNIASLPVIDSSRCNGLGYYLNMLTENMMCAGGDDGVGSCVGDSGAPLVCNFKTSVGENWVLAGLSSWGYGCGEHNKPGVFTTVSSYIDWVYGYIL